MRFRDETIGCTLLLICVVAWVVCFTRCDVAMPHNASVALRQPTLESPSAHVPFPKPEQQLAERASTPSNEHPVLAPQPASPPRSSHQAQAAARAVVRPTLDRLVPVQPVPTHEPALRWYTSFDAAKQASQLTGKPTLVYWYGDNCPACRTFDRNVLRFSRVHDLLIRRFVCAKVNAEQLNRSPAERERLKAWGVVSIPAVSIVSANWKTFQWLRRTNDPQNFIQQLNAIRNSPARGTPTAMRFRPSTRTPVRTAQWQPPRDDAYSADPQSVESTPFAPSIGAWAPTPTRVQPVQYGSHGGSGPYRFVLMNGGGYAANGGDYAVNSGAYRVGYGPGGGMHAYTGHYRHPAFYQPPTYRQPTRFPTGYTNGRVIVCRPWGCALQ
jgi:hypothetical protein